MKPHRPGPDIMVHPTLGMGSRTSLVVSIDGPPCLIIEVASPTTVANDINLVNGKAAAYAAIGVAEYIVFDPTGEDLGIQVWERRLGPSGFVPWDADDTQDARGRWRSRTLGIAFAPEGVLLRVYDSRGSLVPLITEQAAMLDERERQIAELEAELRRLRGG